MAQHPTPHLDQVTWPWDMRDWSIDDLTELAKDLRNETIDAVSVTGGHLGAGLGVVELTVAIHHVFDTPYDKVIWDVGHQAYPHKILTGRRDRIRTLRQAGGLSGFTKRAESDYDPFGAGHSSTSISAGLGMAAAAKLQDRPMNVISVIGDGSISAGMAYEAMNNAGSMDSRLIVILNDNEMSIAPAVGAMSHYLSRVVSSKQYRGARDVAKEISKKFPKPLQTAARRAEEFARGFVAGGTLFEELGFLYIGPVDGHNLDVLVPILKSLRDRPQDGPVLVHCVTEKGKGHPFEKESTEKYHAVQKFDVVTGTQVKKKPNAPSYTAVFASALIAEAEQDESIVAITAAMPSGTGVGTFQDRFPERTFDVGIAEQHAVTFAAGLACEGVKPFCAVYSTFLQRGYDQVVHDVAIQKLPVRLILDRAGFVGADGATHCGAFDLAYLGCLPGMTIMSPSDERELMDMVATAVGIDEGPSAIRYPRGEGIGVDLAERGTALTIGKGRVVKEGTKVAILSLGGRLQEALIAAETLDGHGLSTTVADARFAKPIDTDLVDQLATHHEVLLTVEEGSSGGFATLVMTHLANSGRFDAGLKFRPVTMLDKFLDHESQDNQYAQCGLDAQGIVATALSALGHEAAAIAAQAGD